MQMKPDCTTQVNSVYASNRNRFNRCLSETGNEEPLMTRGVSEYEDGGEEKPSAAMALLRTCDADSGQTEHIYQEGDTLVFDETGDKADSTSLTAVLKEEIKYTIQTKRLARGLSELTVEHTPAKQEKLSPEEEERRKERRDRNRMAATKCRNKKRDRMLTLEKETHKLQAQNEYLLEQLEQLNREKEELTFMLNAHLIQCTRRNAIQDHRDS